MSTPKELINAPSKRKCPGSFANLGEASPAVNPNTPSLRRWKATWEALEAELIDSPKPAPPEEQFDPVQAAIVAAQVNRVRKLLPSLDQGEIDRDWPHLIIPIDTEELRVSFQFTQTSSEGLLKMFKLKTAQIDEETEFATAAEEIAAIVTDPRYPDRLEAYEMRTADGELIRLEMPRRQAREVLAELEADYQKMANSDPMIVAGPHCVTCKVADLCDAFPRLDEGAEKINPPKKRKPSAFRLMISKSRLPEMAYCERRAAWRLWFSIPPDQDHYSREISPGLAVGNRFHHLMAKALLSDEPASVFSGDLEMESLYRQHLSLPCTSTLNIKETEFPLGFSVRFGAGHKPVSVVLYGIADGVGREEDGTAAVIDHKTGSSPRAQPFEAELYALGAFLRLKSATVATHIHRLSTIGEDPVCDRKVWERTQMEKLILQLGRIAESAAQWDYLDATSPPFQVGEWCSTCPFERRCRSHR